MARPWNLLLVLPLLLASSQACHGSGVPGSGVVKTETRAVEPFSAITITGEGQLRITAGAPSASLTVSGDDNLLPLVRTTVTGGRLTLEPVQKISPKADLVFTINVPDLKEISCTGAANVQLAGVSNDALRLAVSGAAKITAQGQTGTLTLELSGAADVEATGLKAKVARLQLSGAGKVDLFASESLEATISGAGRVRYAGEPKDVQKHVAGLGSIEKL